jgi:hypothetical protein
MNFSTIFQNFKSLSTGTDAFKQLKNECEQTLLSPTSNTLDHSSLLLIYGFAKNYVLLYEDEAVTSQFAQSAKQQLIEYMSILDKALQEQNAQAILQALNSISNQYMKSSRIF